MRTKRSGVLRVALMAVLVLAACGPKTPPVDELSPEQVWQRGVEAYTAEEWTDAIRYFDRYVLVGGTDPRVHQARFYVAQAHFNRKQYVTSAIDFSRLASDLGRAELADEARFMACRSYEELSPGPQLDQEYTRAAVDHCSALLEYFPQSSRAEQAGEIIDRMLDKLAEKVYQAGEWYRGRRAYDSAILYFEDVVEQYPSTVFAPRALLQMYEIYGILEWQDEREETRQRLLSEYPQSDAAQSLETA